MDDPTNRQLLQDHLTTLKTGADTVATASQKMAAPVKDYHDATVALGNDNASAINALELSISLIAITAGVAFLFSLGSSAVVAAGAIDADIALTINAIQTSYRASQMVRVIGLTSLAVGAVGTIDAFHALPAVDLDKAITNLAAIIGMTVFAADDTPDDTNERKENPQGPGESPVWKDLKPYRGRTRTNGKNGKAREYYEWDYTHNDIEAYDSKGNHLGSIDPITGKIYKPAVPGRTIQVG